MSCPVFVGGCMVTGKDEEITGDIIAALGASPDVNATEIRVDTNNGGVWLHGVVGTLEERLVAEEIARRVSGVKIVENDLVLSPNREMSDLEIERCVQARLESEGPAGVGTRVHAGTAFLMGVLPSLADKEKAKQVAGESPGVRDVVSELEIAAGQPMDDITLSNHVVDALAEAPGLQFLDLDVQSQDGSIVLHGEVGHRQEADLAASIAAAVPGVKRLENRLKVRRPSR